MTFLHRPHYDGRMKPRIVALRCWLLAGAVASGAFCSRAAEEQAASNAPAPIRLNFEPNLPVLALDAKGSIDHEQKNPCTLRLLNPARSSPGSSNVWAGVVKLHGGISLGYPKKSYGLTLSAPVRLLDLRESAHWVLNAAFIDRSLMRHKLSYDLFRSLSRDSAKRFAVASRFVEVYFNGDYQGAYLLMERIDRQLLEVRAFQSNEVRHASIYKAVDHAANFGHPGHAGYEQREPDPLTLPYWEPLDELDRFVSSEPDAAFFDPKGGIASRLALDNAIDFHLLVLLTSNGDGITKNFVIARDSPRSGLPEPLFFFAPWDYDGTFGRNWDASAVGSDAWLSNHLFDRLMSDPKYRERFAKRWKELRGNQFASSRIQELIDTNASTLGEAARRNATRWRQAAGYYPDKLSFDEDVAQMKTWVEARLKWLDGEIQRREANN